MEDLLEACRAVIVTAFGITYGLSEAQQIEAMRMAAAALKDDLAKFERSRPFGAEEGALKRIVLAHDQGRDRMAEIAMDALEDAGAAPAPDGRNTPTTKTEPSP